VLPVCLITVSGFNWQRELQQNKVVQQYRSSPLGREGHQNINKKVNYSPTEATQTYTQPMRDVGNYFPQSGVKFLISAKNMNNGFP